MEKIKIYDILNEAYFSDSPHEAATLRAIAPLLRKAKLFVDVGASLGQYTKLANEEMSDGVIYAIEADPVRFEELQRNCDMWSATSTNTIHVVHAAVADTNDPITFFSSESNVSGGLFEHEVSTGPVQWTPISVPAVTLDELLRGNRADLIKVDIEGAEYRAMLGATRTLAKASSRTRVLMEIHPWTDPITGQGPSDVHTLMRRYGFKSYIVDRSHMFKRGLFFGLYAGGRTVGHRVARMANRLPRRLGPK